MPADDLTNALLAAYKVEVEGRGRDMSVDESTMAHIRAAARWLSDPQEKPGLMLQGLYGNGKTTLMIAIRDVVNFLFGDAPSSGRRTIRIIEAKEIARLGVRETTRHEYERLINEMLLAIDDLGEEPPEIINYGMVYTPVKDLLLKRYERNLFTIISTNLINTKDNPQLENHYGARIVDRLREMMNIIVFRNGSYRGNHL